MIYILKHTLKNRKMIISVININRSSDTKFFLCSVDCPAVHIILSMLVTTAIEDTGKVNQNVIVICSVYM